MQITKDIRYIGVNDHEIDLFEGQYIVPEGMAYNSYVILDDQIAVMDTVEGNFVEQWLQNLQAALQGRTPDYLIVQHMEPDHSAGIAAFMREYPQAAVVANARAFTMLQNFYALPLEGCKKEVADGETLTLGRHTLQFVFAPLVHWPEVMFTYDAADKVLFSADAFGKFGALDTEDDEWDCEARRYYFGIVGKYGLQVQKALAKAAQLDIQTICPLHGPVLTGDLSHYLQQYSTWAAYQPETEGVMIAYATIYGHTREAAEKLAQKLTDRGCPKVVLADLARADWAECVEDAFRYSKLVLASVTYNGAVFPTMRAFIESLTERGYQSRTLALMENGSWAPTSTRQMKAMFDNSKNITWLPTSLKINSALHPGDDAVLDAMAAELWP